MEQTVIRDGAEMPQRCSTGAAQVQHTWRRNSAERTERWSRNGAETVGDEVETVGEGAETRHMMTARYAASYFQPRNVYFNSETSSLHWKSKLRNVWGQ